MDDNNVNLSRVYHYKNPPFLDLISDWKEQSIQSISGEFSERVNLIATILNLDYKIAGFYMPMLLKPNMAYKNPRTAILISAYHRNLFAFLGSFEISKQGLFGPARSILRHIFESLVTAKFCSLSKDDKVYSQWKNGEAVYFGNGVLKMIVKPDTQSLNEYWKILSEFSHATIYAQQFSLSWEHVSPNTQFTWDIILALLECHYHLLISHLATPSVKYYTEYSFRLINQKLVDELKSSKSLIKDLFKKSKVEMHPSLKRLANDYKRTWQIKEK